MAKKEKVYSLGGSDDRSGGERVAAVLNKVLSGNRKSPARSMSDSPAQMAKNRKASAPTSKPAPKRKRK